MSGIQSHIKRRKGLLTSSPGISFPLSTSLYSSLPPSYTSSNKKESTPSTYGGKISSAILIIVTLAVICFISGLLHLLVRFLRRKPSPSSTSQSTRYTDMSGSDALQRQLQQLFHLDDSGLDQNFIDALPVFLYKEIMGPKEPFDCAVCLSEFSELDKLRLLPLCSHAFHINCIDTWLLSNSTCPLCRRTLFSSGIPIENPVFEFDDLKEEDGLPRDRDDPSGNKTGETTEVVSEIRVFPVRLGKFRNLNNGGGGEESSSNNLDARRCYSMGSFQYVFGDSNLQVLLLHDRDVGDVKPVKGRGHNGSSSVVGDIAGKRINNGSKGESFSISKIWLWSKKGKFPISSDCCQTGVPSSSLTVDLPWHYRTEGV